MAKYAGKERVVHAMVEYDSDGERVLSEEERYVAKQIGRARENEPSKYPVLRCQPRPALAESQTSPHVTPPPAPPHTAKKCQPEDTLMAAEEPGRGGLAAIFNPWVHLDDTILRRMERSRKCSLTTSGMLLPCFRT